MTNNTTSENTSENTESISLESSKLAQMTQRLFRGKTTEETELIAAESPIGAVNKKSVLENLKILLNTEPNFSQASEEAKKAILQATYSSHESEIQKQLKKHSNILSSQKQRDAQEVKKLIDRELGDTIVQANRGEIDTYILDQTHKGLQQLLRNQAKRSYLYTHTLNLEFQSSNIDRVIQDVLDVVQQTDIESYKRFSIQIQRFKNDEIDTIPLELFQDFLSYAQDSKIPELIKTLHPVISSNELYAINKNEWRRVTGITNTQTQNEDEKRQLESWLLAQNYSYAITDIQSNLYKEILNTLGAKKLKNDTEDVNLNRGVSREHFDEIFADDNIVSEDIQNSAGIREKYMQWGQSHNRNTVNSFSHLKVGNILAMTKGGVEGFYKIHSLPENNTDELVELEYIGNIQSGITPYKRGSQFLTAERFFTSITTGCNACQVLQTGREWDEYKLLKNMPSIDEAIEETDRYEYFLEQMKELESKGKIKNPNHLTVTNNTLFRFSHPGGNTYLKITNLDTKTGTYTLTDGSGFEESHDLGSLFMTIEKPKIGAEIVSNVDMNEELFTKQATKNIPQLKKLLSYSETEGFQMPGTKKNTKEPCNTFQLKGKNKDIRIMGVEGESVTVESGYIDKKGAWNGGQEEVVSWYLLLGHLEENTVTGLKQTKIKEYEREDIKEDSFLSQLLGNVKTLGDVFALGKEAISIPRDMVQSANEAAGKRGLGVLLNRFPGKYDWLIGLKGQINASINNEIEEYLNKILGETGSEMQADLIEQWSRHDLPDIKCIAAMLGSLQAFGHLYPRQLAKKDPPFCDYFWYMKLSGGRHPKDDPNFPNYYENVYGEGSYKKAPRPAWKHANETDITQHAFSHYGGRRFKQFTNMWRMYGKRKIKGSEGTWSGAEGNLNERNGYHAQRKWMVDCFTGGKPDEMLAGIEIFASQGYSAKQLFEVIFQMYTTGVLRRMSTENLKKLSTIFASKGIHCPMLLLCTTPDQIAGFQDASIAMAYTISKSAGKQLEQILENVPDERMRTEGSGETAESQVKATAEFWNQYGQDMVNLMTFTNNPALLIMHAESQDASLPKSYPGIDEKYTSAAVKYVEGMHEAMDETGIDMKKSGAMDKGVHTINSETGFPTGLLLNPLEFIASNTSGGFWNGMSSAVNEGDMWKEVMKFVKNIPDLATKMANRSIESGSKASKVQLENTYAKLLYDRVKHGPKIGSGKGMKALCDESRSKASDKTWHWSHEAVSYNFLETGSKRIPEITNQNAHSWIRERELQLHAMRRHCGQPIDTEIGEKDIRDKNVEKIKSHTQKLHTDIFENFDATGEVSESDTPKKESTNTRKQVSSFEAILGVAEPGKNTGNDEAGDFEYM